MRQFCLTRKLFLLIESLSKMTINEHVMINLVTNAHQQVSVLFCLTKLRGNDNL